MVSWLVSCSLAEMVSPSVDWLFRLPLSEFFCWPCYHCASQWIFLLDSQFVCQWVGQSVGLLVLAFCLVYQLVTLSVSHSLVQLVSYSSV